ncbi:sodium/potassium/calcium exchanger 4-like [Tubulanus polymorphus]|uniref:sodium/potassium/calcium exchanger 4-like n=1 Tax=Tubulanus polymorphus TaxID=672921 RepID=UPI003DA5ED6F
MLNPSEIKALRARRVDTIFGKMPLFRPWKRRSSVWRAKFVFVWFVFVSSGAFYHWHGKQDYEGLQPSGDGIEIHTGKRHLLVVSKVTTYNGDETTLDERNNLTSLSVNITDANSTVKDKCTPPAYHEFPKDLFTNRQRSHGALVIHVCVVCYMFYALALVCDDYFVSSLDKICEKLHIGEDVAGATFMAAGSSAPELFTSVIGVFIAKGDVGVGTIVGSAVFNILFVIGICGLLAGAVVPLCKWPLLRDSGAYCITVIALILSIMDSVITWYESLIMLILYAGYIALMRYNVTLQKFFNEKFNLEKDADAGTETSILPPVGDRKYYGNYGETNGTIHQPDEKKSEIPPKITVEEPTKKPDLPERFENEEAPAEKQQMSNGVPTPIKADEYFIKDNRKIRFEEACFKVMMTRHFRPRARFRAAAMIVISERKRLLRDPAFMKRHKWKTHSFESSMASYTKAVRCLSMAEDETDLDEWKRLPSLDSGVFSVLTWAVSYPIRIVLYFTTPDCRKQSWEKWFIGTFIMSIVWIATFSYVMVWMVTLIGFTLGIPDSIMGITFLAAGTSIPDAMASVIVARQGLGDMAVSNTIGSNVFDILIGLAFPWFIKTGLSSAGSVVHINSNGMVFSVVLLFLTVIFTLGSIHFYGWKIDKKLGVLFLIVYVIFVIFSVLIEFNIFGYVNAPMCLEF